MLWLMESFAVSQNKTVTEQSDTRCSIIKQIIPVNIVGSILDHKT